MRRHQLPSLGLVGLLLGPRRTRLQEQIQELAKEQRRFIEAERARQADKAGASLGAALVDALTAQAEAKGFTFDRPEPAAAR